MFDLAVIGAGWAGFSAAHEANRLGLKVALIEKDKIGGTCLNRGCIPTKALIQSARVYSLSKRSSQFGIELSGAKINFPEIQKRKEAVVSQLASGMKFMLKGISLLNGQAQFISNQELAVGQDRIKAKHIVIATGSKPLELSGLRFDGRKIISSSDILSLNSLPGSILIIGGGVIGCEFASLFSLLGSQVTIVELTPQLLPQEDKEVAKKLEVIFKKAGIKVNTNTDAKTLNLDNYQLALLCIGRVPDLGGLDLEGIGVQSERSGIVVDRYISTNIPNIFAAGDCSGEKLLAHFAAHQGIVAARNIARPASAIQIEPQLIPNCIFTDPEIASLGINEQEAKDKGIKLKINKLDFLASGMARILGEAEGFIKIISNQESGEILGASIIGPKASELIGIVTLAMQAQLKLPELHNIIFAHPTLTESFHQATKN
jgi:dihydrolipoamide dehydrogenase